VDADNPIITLALQVRLENDRQVWNLHTADGDLIGWSPDLPTPMTTKPSCFEYGTGAHRTVTFAPDARTVEL
jgi:hypothetical protein